jgi:hypothetical protein
MAAYPKGSEVFNDSNTSGAWKQLFSTPTQGRAYVSVSCPSAAVADALIAYRPAGAGAPAGLTDAYAHQIAYRGAGEVIFNADPNTEVWYTGSGGAGAVTIVSAREMVDR